MFEIVVVAAIVVVIEAVFAGEIVVGFVVVETEVEIVEPVETEVEGC